MEEFEQPDLVGLNGMNAPEQVLRQGKRMGYGLWLTPFMNDTKTPEESSDHQEAPNTSQSQISTDLSEASTSTSEPRPRGRPRVTAARNESAIEKRRAQVRNAQRTYQKRKDTAAQTVTQRCDDLLEVLLTISTEVEELLRLASKAGDLGRRDDVGVQMRRLCDTYDTAINSPCVTPDLRLLQVKNAKRRMEHQSRDNFRIEHPSEGRSGSTTPRAADERQSSGPNVSHQPDEGFRNPATVDLSLVRGDGSTMIQSFRQVISKNPALRGRSIFDVIQERQAEFRNNDSTSI